MGKLFGKMTWGQFWGSIGLAFLTFAILSVILSHWFATFADIVSKFPMIFSIAILTLLLFLIFKLVIGMKTFDKKSIFILGIAIAIILFLVIYVFGGEFPGLFDGSIIKPGWLP